MAIQSHINHIMPIEIDVLVETMPFLWHVIFAMYRFSVSDFMGSFYDTMTQYMYMCLYFKVEPRELNRASLKVFFENPRLCACIESDKWPMISQ